MKNVNERQYIFPMSEGMAYIRLPSNMNQKDIEILKKHIEILEVEIED